MCIPILLNIINLNIWYSIRCIVPILIVWGVWFSRSICRRSLISSSLLRTISLRHRRSSWHSLNMSWLQRYQLLWDLLYCFILMEWVILSWVAPCSLIFARPLSSWFPIFCFHAFNRVRVYTLLIWICWTITIF